VEKKARCHAEPVEALAGKGHRSPFDGLRVTPLLFFGATASVPLVVAMNLLFNIWVTFPTNYLVSFCFTDFAQRVDY